MKIKPELPLYTHIICIQLLLNKNDEKLQLHLTIIFTISIFFFHSFLVRSRDAGLAPGLRGITVEQTVLLLRHRRVAEGRSQHATPARLAPDRQEH